MPLGCVGRDTNCTTPPNASLLYKLDPPSCEISTSEIASAGTRSQYTHSPNGSFSGTPSSSTSARLAPFAPSPRNETPCVVGFAVRLLDRRNKLNPGTCRRSSSSCSAGVFCKSSRVNCTSLAGTSLSSVAARYAVTCTCWLAAAGVSTISTCSTACPSGHRHACSIFRNPIAVTDKVPAAPATFSNANAPPASVTTEAENNPARTSTCAPTTTAPLESRTTPSTRPATPAFCAPALTAASKISANVPPANTRSARRVVPREILVNKVKPALPQRRYTPLFQHRRTRIISQRRNSKSSKTAARAEVLPAPPLCYRVPQSAWLHFRRKWHGDGFAASQ